MRVLLSAFACEPDRGSETGLGWGLVREVAGSHDVWVLTEASHRSAIEWALSREPLPTARFLFIPGSLSGESPIDLNRGESSGAAPYLSYILWQARAYRAAKSLHRRIGFDLVHHLTWVNSWLPTWMGLLGPAFVWNAGVTERTLVPFLRDMSVRGKLQELNRSIAMVTLGLLTHRWAARRAAAILSGSEPGSWDKSLPVIQLYPNAIEDSVLNQLGEIPPRNVQPFRVISMGRLLEWKGFALGLRAFARLRREFPDAEYWLIGEGPARQRLEAIAHELDCLDAVRFTGWLPRAECLRLLAEVDVLVHPSLHDGLATVLLEAMAARRPVVCLGIGGNAVVAEGGGLVVGAETPARAVDGIHGALRSLLLDPRARLLAGQRGRDWVEQTRTWGHIGGRVLGLYEQVAARPSGHRSAEG